MERRNTKTKIYKDGQFVALEQRQCVVCGELYETGSLLMDTMGRNVFENKYACTGLGLCPEHQKFVDDGYIICIEVNNKPSKDGELMKPEDADRTGNLCYIKKEVAQEIFNMPMDSPITYFEVGVIDKLKCMVENSMKGENTEENCARAV